MIHDLTSSLQDEIEFSPPDSFELGEETRLFGKVEVVVQPFASIHARDIQARGAVGQRRIEAEAPDGDGQNDQGGHPARDERLGPDALLGRDESAEVATHPGTLGLARRVIHGGWGGAGVEWLQVEDKFNQRTSHHGRGQVRRQVVMQEALTAHQPEGEIVGGPAQEQEARAVVQTRTGARTPD